jgi:glycosyltransferase involved in cell wall biosynthesis
MKFHALLPVRDEADIIAQCLQHLLTWADSVYIFDTGSVDNTWEIVQDFASRDKRVVPIRKEPVYYSETKLRGYMFHVARKQMRDGDWFLRVDADEFHHVLPPEFVKTYLQPHETIVYHQYYDFQLTESEVAAGVTYEALAAGIPVVTTNASGSVVQNGIEGYIVSERDPDALAKAIAEIVEDRPKREKMAINARERAKDYTWDKYGEALVTTLKNHT